MKEEKSLKQKVNNIGYCEIEDTGNLTILGLTHLFAS